MCQTFSDLDHSLGGEHTRSTLMHYLSTTVLTVLNGRYAEATGRGLMAAAARLCGLAAFMAFDCEVHGLAQRYYIQASRLAQAAGDRALGAHILADMSMQAQHLHDPGEAVTLAVAGQHTSRDCGSAATLARWFAMKARAYALVSDQAACSSAINQAERALGRTRDDEPSWIRFFTAEQLATDKPRTAATMGR